MKMKRQMSKTWWLSILILLVAVNVATELRAQDAPADTSANSAEVAQTPQADQSTSVVKTIENWVRANPLTALGVGILTPIVIGLVVWILIRLVKGIMIGLKPAWANLSLWMLTRLGRHETLLNRYRQKLQHKLKEVGLTQQLLGEGVDLDKNYIAIQLSKEEYKHPEADMDDEPGDGTRQGVQVYPEAEEQKMERIDVEKVLLDQANYGGRVVIVGDPGSGKTTLLQYLAYQCTKGEGVRPIPVLITLTAYMDHKAMSLRAYIEALFEENGFPKAKSFIDKQFKRGNLLILFDGFDEVELSRRIELREQIKALANNQAHLQNVCVVTSRPVRDATIDQFRHLEVMPLTAEQRRKFLESKVDDSPKSDFSPRRCGELVNAIESHNRVKKLAENPLLLTFLYHVYKYNMELPRRRVELYRLSVNLMLDWDLETNRPTHIRVMDRDAKKEVLKKLAYHYHTKQRRDLSEREVVSQVKKYLPESLRAKFTAEELLSEIENSSGIVRHRTADSYQFIHLTFQEYLTADYINNDRDEEIPTLVTRLHNPWWREATLLLASMMGNVTFLVSQILEHAQHVTEESERLACVFIAFSCLYEGEVDDEMRNQVLRVFVELPYQQAVDGIQAVVGPIEAENEALEKLFINILSNPQESVQAWGVGFLLDYPQFTEKSERLSQEVQKISEQAFEKLPDKIQERILGVHSFKQITEGIWRRFASDLETPLSDYHIRLYDQCLQTTVDEAVHRHLLLAQNVHYFRFLIGRMFLQGDSAIARFKTDRLFFSPDRNSLPPEPTFSGDFVEIWRDNIPRFINVLRVLHLIEETSHEEVRKLVYEGAQERPLVLALELYQALDLRFIPNLDFGDHLQKALDSIVSRALEEAVSLSKALNLNRALDRARGRSGDDWALNRTWNEVWELTQDPHLDLERVIVSTQKLMEELDINPLITQTMDFAEARAGAHVIDSETIELLALAQSFTLAAAITHVKQLIGTYPESLQFVRGFLQTTATQHQESSWYILTIAQQVHAASFVMTDSTLMDQLQQQWENRSDKPEIRPYQSACFVNLGTLLHSFGIGISGTFFDEVVTESAAVQKPLVLRVSYLLHQILVNRTTEDERREFWHIIGSDAPEIREWLELSGLTWIIEK